MDDLSVQLNKCTVGCTFHDLLVNHIMYADDLATFLPNQLLDLTSYFKDHVVVPWQGLI